MEGDLLAIRHRTRDRASAMAVWAQRDSVAAKWAKGAGEAGAEICGCGGGENLTAGQPSNELA